MNKTDKMLLVESRDGRKRDIKEILRDAYGRTGRLDTASTLLSRETGIDIGLALFHRWVHHLGGVIRTSIEFPEADVPAEEPMVTA